MTAIGAAPTTHSPEAFVIAGCIALGLYFVALLVFDRYLSARSSVDLLHNYLGHLDDLFAHGRHHDRADYEAARTRITKVCDNTQPGFLWTMSATRSLSGWREAHRLKLMLVRDTEWQHARTRLVAAAAELDQLKTPDATALAKKIGLVLAKPTPLDKADEQEAVVDLLRESYRIRFDARDAHFELLSDTQSKAVWLAILGIVLIVVAGLAKHRELLFLFGALGAFLSRLGRLMHRKPTDNDYGASAGAIFVSPVAGALAGWVGVLVVAALASKRIGLLNDDLHSLWTDWSTQVAFLVAVLFGFSERLLTKVLRSAQSSVTPSNPDAGDVPAPAAN